MANYLGILTIIFPQGHRRKPNKPSAPLLYTFKLKTQSHHLLLTLILLSLPSVLVLLLPRPAVLEPDLRHPLAEAGDLGDPLQVLAVRVGVQLEVRLEDLQLFLGEGRADPLRFAFVVTLRITPV